MQCLECGKNLGEEDLAAGSCQGCGEPLMPEDVSNLESKLGIAKEVPEVKAPVLIPEGGIKVPDVLICKNPDCGEDLYGDDIEAYLKGDPCQICGQPDPSASSTPTPESMPSQEQKNVEENINLSSMASEEEVPVETETTPVASEPVAEPFMGKTLRTRFCSGPLAGTEFDLPTGIIIGRQLFNEIISAESKSQGIDLGWYNKSISRISREHFKLDEDGTITDMGSANGTILDREEIFGEGDKFGEGVKFGLGNVLNLADEIMLTRVHSSDDDPSFIRITNTETKITIDVPQGVKYHLGRLREDGRREPFALAISDHMKRTDGMNADDFRRISRRHATVELQENGEFLVENIEGKTVTINPGIAKSKVDEGSTVDDLVTGVYTADTLGDKVTKWSGNEIELLQIGRVDFNVLKF